MAGTVNAMLLLWAMYQDSKYISDSKTPTEAMERSVEVGVGWGGMASGAAAGAKFCAPAGPELALLCGLMGGFIGSETGRAAVRYACQTAKQVPQMVEEGVQRAQSSAGNFFCREYGYCW